MTQPLQLHLLPFSQVSSCPFCYMVKTMTIECKQCPVFIIPHSTFKPFWVQHPGTCSALYFVCGCTYALKIWSVVTEVANLEYTVGLQNREIKYRVKRKWGYALAASSRCHPLWETHRPLSFLFDFIMCIVLSMREEGETLQDEPPRKSTTQWRKAYYFWGSYSRTLTS